jgi:hypothetical protein
VCVGTATKLTTCMHMHGRHGVCIETYITRGRA